MRPVKPSRYISTKQVNSLGWCRLTKCWIYTWLGLKIDWKDSRLYPVKSIGYSDLALRVAVDTAVDSSKCGWSVVDDFSV